MKLKAPQLAEVTIVVVAQNHNPTILNPDFLKFNDIVPREWEPDKPPVCAFPIGQVSYPQGLSILAQPEVLTFTQSEPEPSSGTTLAKVVAKYVNRLPYVDYLKFGLNPKFYSLLEGQTESNAFIRQTFLKKTDSMKFRDNQPSVGLKLAFVMKEGKAFNLSVDEGLIQIRNQTMGQGVMFSANFHHDLLGSNTKERLENLLALIDNGVKEIEEGQAFISSAFCST